MAKGHLQGAVGSLGTLALLRDRSAHLGQRSPPTNWRYPRCDGGCHDSTTLRKNVVRVDRGVYSLRTLQSVPPEESETELPDSRGVIPPIALEAGDFLTLSACFGDVTKWIGTDPIRGSVEGC